MMQIYSIIVITAMTVCISNEPKLYKRFVQWFDDCGFVHDAIQQHKEYTKTQKMKNILKVVAIYRDLEELQSK